MKNQKFKSNVVITEILPPDIHNVPLYALLASSLFLSAYFVSKTTTDRLKKSTHREFLVVKAQALTDDLETSNYFNIRRKTLESAAQVIDFELNQGIQEEIDKLKPESQKMYEYLIASREAGLDDLLHQVNTAETREILTKKLVAIKKLEKELSKPDAPVDKSGTTQAQRVKQVISALKKHEGGWLWKIIDNQTPLWITGRPGSAKTWTMGAIGLIRKYCLDIPVRIIMDEHGEGFNGNIWGKLEPERLLSSVEQIAEAIPGVVESWDTKIKNVDEAGNPALPPPEQLLIDEFTTFMHDIGEPAEVFYRRHLKDCRKAYVYVVGVTHSDTNDAYPKGTKKQRDSSTLLIQKYSANGSTPVPRVTVIRGFVDEKGTELKEFEATIPDWLNPLLLNDHFTGVKLITEIDGLESEEVEVEANKVE
ncbi:MAG: hypothetical protein HC773_00845 [Scytonema sp. CRU_2_7]|nr:hypothetical protein [Scytonema sp. CRU_2_7]